MPKDQNEHALQMGRLLGMFQNLELALRLYLNIDAVATDHRKGKIQPFSLQRGEKVLATPLTDYAQLRALIQNYNDTVPKQELRVDPSIVAVRDALCHGRVLAPVEAPPLTLFKFSSVDKNGMVELTVRFEMSDAWFEEQLRSVRTAFDNVREAAGPAIFPS